jgi:hypothetical protein
VVSNTDCRDFSQIEKKYILAFRMRTIVLLMILTVGGAKEICAQNAVTKKEVAAFLNAYYDSSEYYHSLRFIDRPNSPYDIEKIRLYDSAAQLFTNQDFDFMERQVRNYKPVILDSSYIKNANFLSHRILKSHFSIKRKSPLTAWEIFYKKYGKGFWRISYPLFNKEKNLCVIYQQRTMGGVYGSGDLFIYKKEGTGWVPYKIFRLWVS